MKLKYQVFLLALALCVVFWPTRALAQIEGSPLVVEWEDENGEVIVNALRDAIATDVNRPPDRVYVLKRGGFYWNEDRITADGFDLVIVGETADAVPPGEIDYGPAIIQRVVREDQSVDGVMFQTAGDGTDFTLRNVWLMGQDDQGVRTAYHPIQLNANNARITFDNVIFDRAVWQYTGVTGTNPDVFITNCVFRNLFGTSQQWEGRGIRLEAGADTVVIENNTFFNIGMTIFQSEAAPANYVRINHNTMVNVGRTLQAGNAWIEAYITNNIFVNPFFHGEGAADRANEQPDDDPYTGFFGIGPLPAAYGTNLDREIVFANNSYWRDPAFDEGFYGDSIRAQPIVNDTTMGYFRTYPDNMKFQNNYIGVNPELTNWPDIPELLWANINDMRTGVSPATEYIWDPGRDEECFVCLIWPLPEDFTYSNTQLLTGGTDGLPLGDLNWYPEAKATFEANKETYIKQIEDMVEAADLVIIGTVEAETGQLDGGAEVVTPDGFTYYRMEGSGSIEWKFNVEEAGTYDLIVETNMGTETQRGQRIIVNGVNLRNNSDFGEYYFCTASIDGCALPLPNNEWVDIEIKAGELVEGAEGLDLPAGENTVRIEPSWGYQNFGGIRLVNAAGETVIELTAADADANGVIPRCADDIEFCPAGFQAVSLDANQSVSFNFDAPGSGNYILRVFYYAPDGAQASILADGQVVVQTLDFAAGEGELLSAQFPLQQGVSTVTVQGTSGALQVDYVQLIGVGITTDVERGELPEGFALDQNYPNPFNPTTTINYKLAAPGNVRLTVFDVLGRRVQVLVNGDMPAGTHTITWDGRNAAGQMVASGVYFYRLETPVGAMTRSMILMK